MLPCCKTTNQEQENLPCRSRMSQYNQPDASHHLLLLLSLKMYKQTTIKPVMSYQLTFENRMLTRTGMAGRIESPRRYHPKKKVDRIQALTLKIKNKILARTSF